MSLFGLRFDLRNPDFAGVDMADRYAAALDMAEWADRQGFVVVVLSEHHGSEDGYLPSPLPMAAAIAARTESIRIQIAALVAPFYDPLRLAEDIAVVDLLSRGRLDVVLANGYVGRELEAFDVPPGERARRTTEAVHVLKQAWTGEAFEYRGRTVQVTPTPAQPGGPAITLGGSTPGAARRAARIADGFLPSTPGVWADYRDEVQRQGKPDPGEWAMGDTNVVYVAADQENGWRQLAPHALHETNSYGSWMADAGLSATGGYVPVEDEEALRASGQYRVLTPDALVAEVQARGPFAFTLLHPLVGGFPPEPAWESLRLVEREVLPRLAEGR